MKILIVNAYDTVGGASRAAYRIHQSLLVEGVDSIIIAKKYINLCRKILDDRKERQ